MSGAAWTHCRSSTEIEENLRMSKRHFLEFEQPIAELDAKIEELR